MAKRRGQYIDGVLLLNKPVDLSSNHALQRSKRALDARKAGHTGTLDPFATGLLICCFGKATKISQILLEADKSYIATLKLGAQTDSGDLTGTITNQIENFDGISQDQISNVLPQFTGDIQQIPPMYSALKRDGKPLYKYAREGIVLDRPPRDVTIHKLNIVEFSPTEVKIFVRCSKGTYIRTLAEDIGLAIGCYAHLTALHRTEIESFSVDDAIDLETLQTMDNPQQALIPLLQLPENLQLPSFKI